MKQLSCADLGGGGDPLPREISNLFSSHSKNWKKGSAQGILCNVTIQYFIISEKMNKNTKCDLPVHCI